MRQISTPVLVAATVFATLGLSGCDQLRSNVAAIIQPKTAKDALEAATRAFVAGDYPRTIEEASAFVEAGGEQQGKLALLMARAYAATGKPDQAIRYLYIAAKAGLNRPGSTRLLISTRS